MKVRAYNSKDRPVWHKTVYFWMDSPFSRNHPQKWVRIELMKSLSDRTTEVYPGFKVVSVPVDIMFQVVSMNECKLFITNESLVHIIWFLILVNLAGEYMDVVLALTFEWYDKRKGSTDHYSLSSPLKHFFDMALDQAIFSNFIFTRCQDYHLF